MRLTVPGVAILHTLSFAPILGSFFSNPGFLGFSTVAVIAPGHPGALVVPCLAETIGKPSWRSFFSYLRILPIDIFYFRGLYHDRQIIINEVSEISLNDIGRDIVLESLPGDPPTSLDGSSSRSQLSPSTIVASIGSCCDPSFPMRGQSAVSWVQSTSMLWWHAFCYCY